MDVPVLEQKYDRMILHTHRRENLRSYIMILVAGLNGLSSVVCTRHSAGAEI
jgi:hypothetical protein